MPLFFLLPLCAAAGCISGDDRLLKNTGFPAAPESCYVKSTELKDDYLSVPGNYPAIQEAIDVALDGDVIVVEPGLYLENIDFKGKEIVLRSSDPGDPAIVAATVIHGGGNGSTVVFGSGEGVGTVFAGFTVSGGSGTLLPGHFGFFGGGILVLNGSAPLIENNVIKDNALPAGTAAPAGYGGGIAVLNASPVLSSNTVTGNSAGVNGGGIYLEQASPAVTNNHISYNEASLGGGIAVGGGARPDISGNTLLGNTASEGGGIGVLPGSAPLISGNLIAENSAAIYGGGISVWAAAPLIVENAFEDNRALVKGGGMCISRHADIDAAVRLRNTFRRNYPDRIFYQPDE